MAAKTTETSSDDKHKKDVVTWLMSQTLCEGKLLSSLPTACLKRRSLATTVARAGGADPSQMIGSRTGQAPWQQRNGGYVVTAMTMNNYIYNDETTSITA